MECLAEIDDRALGLDFPAGLRDRSSYKIRHAARAVIFNDKNEIALLQATRDGYHKLPGGGMEEGEDWQETILREALEEVGCEIDLLPQKIGNILEWRGRFRLKQVSFCGAGLVRGAPGRNNLTEEEIAVGLEVRWMTIDRAIEQMKKDAPEDYEGRFIKCRDLIFLQEAQRLFPHP